MRLVVALITCLTAVQGGLAQEPDRVSGIQVEAFPGAVEGVVIAGRVSDARGERLPYAMVVLGSRGHFPAEGVVTDEFGYFEMRLHSAYSDSELRVAFVGMHAPVYGISVAVGDSFSVAASLVEMRSPFYPHWDVQPVFWVAENGREPFSEWASHGLITGSFSVSRGKPMPGFVLELRDSESGERLYQATAGPDGRFLVGVPAGSYRVSGIMAGSETGGPLQVGWGYSYPATSVIVVSAGQRLDISVGLN